MSREESFILQRMIKGDENAFKYFFDLYYDDLCNFVNTYLRDEILSEDIVQNIFIFLWENRNSIPYDCSVKSYLYSASKNKSLNHLRNARKRNRIVEDLFSGPVRLSDEKPDLFLEFDEMKRILTNAVDVLPSKCREIYHLSRNEGLTNQEIAQKLRVSVKTVENQMTIAIRKIKAFLLPYYDQIFILFILCSFF